ncbi:carbohydrate kinase family protein [bacterium]|nr:carbohydrate kinase family protein [bacterium]
MTTLLLGHLVLDEIHALDGSIWHAAGGITFPLGAFNALAGEQDSILPVFPFGADGRPTLQDLASRFPCVSFDHCWEVPQDTTRVRLFHEAEQQYNTQLVRSLSPIPPERFSPILGDAQLVYLNLMTGDDILLEHASLLRGSGRLVYIDLHMIAYRVHADGSREPASEERWKQWLAAGDVVQCNAREFDALTGGASATPEYMQRLLEESGCRHFVLTRGENGAEVFSRNGDCLHVPVVPAARTVDPTGCGDAFGATLGMELARGSDLADAAARAARAASYVVGIKGSVGLEALHDALGEMTR